MDAVGRRFLSVGASVALALVGLTCVEETTTGPERVGAARLSFAALAPAPGEAPVPVESLEITLRRSMDESVALDTFVPFGGGDSAVVRLNVPLRQSPEDFLLSVQALGGGITWYTALGSVRISTVAAAPTPLNAQYVGPGANAARVTMAPADTTAVEGLAFPLRAIVYDSGGNPISGVPVGYRLSDTSRARVTYPTPYTATFTGTLGARDSVWVVAQAPTHIKDSTRIVIVPPAAALVKKSGDSQTSVVNAALPAPLMVRVLDAFGGGFRGDTVRWAVTSGVATLGAPFSVSDDSGYAVATVTPTAVGALSVQAAVVGLAGSPVTFSEAAISGTINTVTVSPKIDTIANGATLQYTAVAKDAAGNVVNTTFGWTSTVPSIATINATSGLATALAGDSTTIIAAAGGVADTARLYVRALQSIALSPPDTVITAVGDSLQLKAAAVDNFKAPLTSGLTIRYLSASPGIAVVNRLSGWVSVVGPGNAVILAYDSVATTDSLIRGSATLRVNQVTAGIVNNPKDSVVVGVGGQTQIVATAVDSNGHPIAGKAFSWVTRPLALSGAPIATVTGSGLVTGLLVDSTYAVDTLVEGTSVFRDSTKVIVSAAPPKLIQWGFDSTAVGNGGSVSIALAVTTPPTTAPVTIAIASTDTTIATAIPNTVTIGVGSAATSAVINGRRAGRAVLTATDVSGQGYASKSMTVGVVSTITLREVTNPSAQQQYFYLNQNETHKAQVWLSDPAPATGLGITFVYKLGTAAVTPSPAVIPAGQLSADITLQGVTPGPGGAPDSVVPTSGGYIGKFSYVYVAPDSLKLGLPYPYNGVVGAGQLLQPYVQITYGMDHPLILANALSAPLGTTAAADTIPINGTTAVVTVNATTPGMDTLTVSAPGWVAAKAALAFTTPQLIASGQTSIVAGSPSDGYWSVTTGDSLRYGHPVKDSLPVTITSSNTSAIVVDTPTTLYVARGQASVSRYTLRALPTAGGDSAMISASAPGYRPDSFKVYVTKPTLQVGLGYPYDGRVALGTVFQNAGYVSIPYARSDTFWVVLNHTRKSVVGGPDSVSIPKGQTTGYFTTVGASLGVDTIGVSRATGYVVQGAPVVLTVGPLHVRPYGYPTTLYTISQGQYVTAIAVDSADGQARPLLAPLQVTLQSSNTQAFTLDSTIVTIPAGQFVTGPDSLRVATADSGRVLSSAPGSTSDSSALIHVNPVSLNVAFAYPYNGAVGRGLALRGNYVYIPAAAPNSVTVAIQRYDRTRDSLSVPSVIIPKGSSTSQPFDILGIDSTGTDSMTAAAPGFVTGRGTITPVPVSLSASRLGANHLTTDAAQAASVSVLTRQGYQQTAVNPVTLTITSTDSTVIRIDSAGSVARGDSATATVPADQVYAAYRVRYVGAGSARIRVSANGFQGDSTELVSVSGPSLFLGYTTVTVGQGQLFPSEYAYVSNPVTGTPLVVYLTRSDSLAPPTSQVFGLSADSVIIAVGSSSSNPVTILGNSAGGAQLIARAVGYSQGTATLSVGQPRMVAAYKTLQLYVGAPATPVPVYTADQTGSLRLVAAATVVGDTSSAPTVVVSDSAVRTIPAQASGAVFNFTGLQKGSAQVTYASPGYARDSTLISVDTASLTLPTGVIVPVGQTVTNGMYVQIPFAATTPVVVSLTSSDPAVLAVPVTVTIPAGGYYVYFDATGGAAAGTATVNASAIGFRAATAVSVTVQ